MHSGPETIIVGAGPAGIAAALRLARAGVAVIVLEGAEYAGAENWSGCVYHADAWLRSDLLGPALWAQAPKERRIVARSLFLHDGVHAAGFEARAIKGNDYGEAWTVLRPKLDRWLAARAVDAGVTLLPATTVTGLRYDGERVTGVNTDRGPLHAPVVFLAEGDPAGLVAREGLERVAQPHYAQGIKAVFRLSAREIERRFGVAPGEGVAQEWVFRNGELGGREVPLDATAFLYTNQDTLSVGLVLPLAALARRGVTDHAHLLRRVLTSAGIAAYLDGAQQVAYGAKVIRAGGVSETPAWVRDGLAIGGSALGLGMEFPYPNFIGPAINSGLCFADAVLALRTHGGAYSRDELEREYAQRLRQTDDYANAALLRAWPQAIHDGRSLFQELPALLGQFVDTQTLRPRAARAQRRRALAMTLGRLRRDLGQARALAKGLGPRRGAATAPPPLAVRFLTARDGGLPVPLPAHDPLLEQVGSAMGYFYGRAQPLLRDRIDAIWRGLRWSALPAAAWLPASAVAGALHLAGDLIAYKWRKLPLRELLLRPYHHHVESTRRALDWAAAARTPLSSATWLAPAERRWPDPRHLFVPLTLTRDAADALHNVCPAEVYRPASRWGGAISQHENCIKCESCRVSVPGIDWNRTSGHRLAYRVPGDGRYGHDGSVEATWAVETCAGPVAGAATGACVPLLAALRARSASPTASWHRHIEALCTELPPVLSQRLRPWLARRAYGWMESELQALLGDEDTSRESVVVSRSADAQRRREQRWQALKDHFTAARLADVVQHGWQADDRERLLAWLDDARDHGEEAIMWLAAYAPGLAWAAANHYLAEAFLGHAQHDALLAPLWRADDEGSNWLPGIAQSHVTSQGIVLAPAAVTARADALDAAQPVRAELTGTIPALALTPAVARWTLALARGQLRVLRARALAYAGERVQFRGEFHDREGRDAIGKFGVIKAMLARIELAYRLLALAHSQCEQAPDAVVALVQHYMGVRMDGVPWLAGQLFGGMAYSEDDILAPRYRDAMVLAHWPVPASVDAAQVRALEARLLAAAADPIVPRDLAALAARPLTDPHASAGLDGADEYAGTAVARGASWSWSLERYRYRSGSFVRGQLLAPEQLLVPEHFRRDPRLRATRALVWRLLRSGFRSPRPGEPYGRYIDAAHGVPPADIARLRAFNAFATIVPAGLGGKGWSKADYAVLNQLTMGERDTSLGLLIMASTSIGTMPVILSLEKDLPREERELAALLGDEAAWHGLAQGVAALMAMLERPEPKAIKASLTRFGNTVRAHFLAPGSALKYLARDFLLSTQALAEAAKRRDLEAMRSQLQACADALPALRERLLSEQAALPARRAAHERFLRFLGTGQISAFALTEPVAGSDTGGIQTRATLRTVPVQPGPHGLYRFTPHGGDEPRLLLDATRLVFSQREVQYQLPDGGFAALDDSEWDLATNRGRRLLRAGALVQAYDDIGTVIERDGRRFYAYWELSGNKMWITNGAIADRYCVYAQSEHGETAFMLERRSEGLRIGPNEHKLGQRASPTNELAFDRVRISADQLVGYPGHGQVNALETLSVGRGGLVTGCATLVDRMLTDYAQAWSRHPRLRRAARFEHDRLQTLAARLVGLMDRADLAHGDFRIEAGLSKYLASEGAHRVLRWLEQIVGPASASTRHLIEKWRRDARILNIYEGTNEVQRFLVLKDLPSLLADTAEVSEDPSLADNPALAAALRAFREFVGPRVRALGARVWQDPDLQARWFAVVEWAGELYSWCALHERAHALRSHGDAVDNATVARLQTAMNDLARHVDAVRARLQEEFAGVDAGETGIADAVVNIASTALDTPATTLPAPVAVGGIDGEWGAILRSRYDWRDERLEWAGWHTGDLAVLDRLLAWADRGGARVRLAVLAPRGVEDRLRRLQAAGAEVVHVVQPPGAAEGGEIAAALRGRWPALQRFAFAGGDGDALVAHLAARLELTLLSGVTALGAGRRGLWVEAAGRRRYLAPGRRVACAWDLKPSGRSDQFTIPAWLAALRGELSAHAPVNAPAVYRRAQPSVQEEALPEAFDSPAELATWVRRRAQVRGTGESPAREVQAAAALAAHVLWLTPATALAHLAGSAALALARDLDRDFAVLAWHDERAAAPVSRCLNQRGLAGLWRWPLTGGDAPTPAALASLVHPDARYLVFDASQRPLAAAVAAHLGWPAFDPISQVAEERVIVAGDGYLAEQALPERAVLVVDRAYGGAPPAESGAAVIRTATLPAQPAATATALERWQSQTAAIPDGGLARAAVIIDVGLGIGDAYQALVPPLQVALREATGMGVEIGATRKITQELKLLPVSRQIGQTGLAVAPQLLLALGISGAPQHMQWIDKNAIVIAINRDADAPIFRWQKDNGAPHVVRCVGDLRVWIPALTQALRATPAAAAAGHARADGPVSFGL